MLKTKSIQIDLDLLAKMYEDGTTTSELAEFFNCSSRTIDRRIQILKRDDRIKNKKNVIKEFNLKIDKSELLKLLALYNTKSEVARKLEVSLKSIESLCKQYSIVDNKTFSESVNKALIELTKDYKPLVIKHKQKTGNESLIIGLADWHTGKIVTDFKRNDIYNIEIFKARIEKLIAAMLKLVDYHITKHVKLKEVYLLCLGDMANGEGIYPTQIYEQEASPPIQVMLVVEYMFKLIQALLDRGLEVKFRGVKGNHGRLGKDADPNSNWDLMIYMILQHTQAIKGIKNLSIEYSNSDYMVVPVRKWRYLLRHEAFAQDETAAGAAKYLGWLKLHNADMIISGHTHHWDVNSRRVVVGSPVGGDDLSEKMAKTDGDPSQLLWLTTDERICTNIYPVDLKSK